MVAAMGAIGFGGVSAFADPSTNWQLASGSAQGSGGLAAFDFSVPDKTRLLYNSKDPALLGNILTSTMSARFTVVGVTGTFTYGGEPSCGGTTGNVRLYFESIPPGTKFAYTNYWWADVPPASAVLANGDFTLTVKVDATQAWSDWNGQPSSANAVEFNAAANNATAVGLSFGGGCFFENGVGTTDGSGTLTLTAFTS
ncbi:MAG TPA: hypothetical protein DCF65_01685 [Chloroflexi bacterium]|nr:hypothetical protein [Chloroflexota bacterium]HAF18433.1 hypothetical protein [Chloroflexota bacterium]